MRIFHDGKNSVCLNDGKIRRAGEVSADEASTEYVELCIRIHMYVYRFDLFSEIICMCTFSCLLCCTRTHLYTHAERRRTQANSIKAKKFLLYQNLI